MINYREADIKCRVEGKRKINAWVKRVVSNHGRELGDVNIVSCSDKYLREINVQFLDHDYYTDIITFDNTEGTIISGELLISFDRVKDNAKKECVSFEE